MKAITYRTFGAARDVLQLEDVAESEPQHGEVVVNLEYSGVNPSDVKARAGARSDDAELPFPMIVPHSDGSGVISEVGSGVSRSRIGERVWIWNGQWQRAAGTAAERITLPAGQAVALPDNVSMQTGAVLGIPALTASHTVFRDGDVTGKTVLVQGGAGTVGLLAVQLAKWGGARVIATARGPGRDRARQAGADAVIDFSAPDAAAQIIAANDGNPVDRIVEVEFGVNAQLDTDVIAENGTVVAYGSVLNKTPTLPFYPLMFKSVTLHMVLVYILTQPQREDAITRLTQALTQGALTCPVDRVFDMPQAAAAHEAVETGGRTGAVLIRTR